MNTRCTCTDRQLEQVGCDCDAQVNVATSELNRRWDEEKAAYDRQVNELYAEAERREQAQYEHVLPPVAEKITVHYSSVDGFHQSRTFKEIAKACAYAAHWVGNDPEIGSNYAVSFDGVGKITVRGVTIDQLFAPLTVVRPSENEADYDGEYDDGPLSDQERDAVAVMCATVSFNH